MYESAKVATTQLHFEPTKPRLSQSSKRERWFHWLFVHHCFKYYLSLTDPHSETTMFVNILTQFLTFTTIYIYQYAAIVSDTSWHIFGHNIYLYIIKQIYIYCHIFCHMLCYTCWDIFPYSSDHGLTYILRCSRIFMSWHISDYYPDSISDRHYDILGRIW
jgi:hypothetical protein